MKSPPLPRTGATAMFTECHGRRLRAASCARTSDVYYSCIYLHSFTYTYMGIRVFWLLLCALSSSGDDEGLVPVIFFGGLAGGGGGGGIESLGVTRRLGFRVSSLGLKGSSTHASWYPR